MADSREGDFQNPGVHDGSIFTVSSSTNGLSEYVSGAGNAAFRGDLLAVSWNGNLPLDLTTQGDGEIFPGTIWVAVYGGDSIAVFTPDSPVTCSNTYSFTLDDDGDQYSNADEIDAGSDPCNPSSLPLDADGDFISDINDNDDDNDGLVDTIDRFPLDSNNGLTTFPPLDYELLNGDPGFGLFGLGFTGLMHDLESDYLNLYADEENSDIEIIAGGAAGLLTYNPAPQGSALGGSNTQINGFQFGLNVQATTPPFTINAEILDPDLKGSNGSIGLFIGDGSQDNFVSLGVTRDGIILTQEINGTASIETFPVDNLAGLPFAEVMLSVNPQEGSVLPMVRLEGNPLEVLGNKRPLGAPLREVVQSAPALAVGLLADNPEGTNFSSTWDSINITLNNEAGCDGIWSNLEESNGEPQARHEADYVRIGNLFYLVGGRGERALNIYNPATDTWTAGATPPVEFHHFQAVAVEGELWIAGAFIGNFPQETPLDHILIYNPVTNSWREGPSIPRPRGGGGVVFYNRKLYLICGITNGHIGGHVAWLDQYDLDTGEWTTLPDAPQARDHFRSVLIDDVIWNAAGRRTASQSSVGSFGNTVTQTEAHNEVEVLDPQTEQWSTLPPLLQGRHGSGVIQYEGDLYIASGNATRGGGNEITSQEKYNTAATHSQRVSR